MVYCYSFVGSMELRCVNWKKFLVSGSGFICKCNSQTFNRTTGNITLTELLHRDSKTDTIQGMEFLEIPQIDNFTSVSYEIYLI